MLNFLFQALYSLYLIYYHIFLDVIPGIYGGTVSGHSRGSLTTKKCQAPKVGNKKGHKGNIILPSLVLEL